MGDGSDSSNGSNGSASRGSSDNRHDRTDQTAPYALWFEASSAQCQGSFSTSMERSVAEHTNVRSYAQAKATACSVARAFEANTGIRARTTFVAMSMGTRPPENAMHLVRSIPSSRAFPIALSSALEREGQNINEVKLTQGAIATMVASDRVTTTRALHKLEEDGMVELGYRSICLTDDLVALQRPEGSRLEVYNPNE